MRLGETFVVTGAILALACGTAQAPAPSDGLRRYQEDLDLLKANVQVVELSDDEGRARVAVVPAYQGRVMTSTAGGPDGFSLGWINEELIASWETLEHINPYGGEDRFWFGPEGGQFAVFFEKGAPFDLEHWQTPGGHRHRALRAPGRQLEPGRVPADGLADQLLRLHLRPPGRPHRPAARARPTVESHFGLDGARGRRRRGLREREPGHQHRLGALDEGDRAPVDLDPGDVPAVRRGHGGDPLRARVRGGARAGGQRRLLRQGALRSAGRRVRAALLPRRRPATGARSASRPVAPPRSAAATTPSAGS